MVGIQKKKRRKHCSFLAIAPQALSNDDNILFTVTNALGVGDGKDIANVTVDPQIRNKAKKINLPHLKILD